MSSKSSVYRLEGMSRGGAAIIAKRCRRWSALLERVVYRDILPYLPFQSLKYEGFVAEPGEKFCWLFTEDAGDWHYSPLLREHRILAAHWLSVLHTHLPDLEALPSFPDRTVKYYSLRRCGIKQVTQLCLGKSLSTGDELKLRELVEVGHTLECYWQEIEELCEAIPQCLIHGDFVHKNLRIRSNGKSMHLLAVDWENTGVGVPATDLAQSLSYAQFPGFAASPCLEAYWSKIRRHWPLNRETIQRIGTLGTIFRCLEAICWEMERFKAGGPLDRYIRRLDEIQSILRYAMKSNGWYH